MELTNSILVKYGKFWMIFAQRLQMLTLEALRYKINFFTHLKLCIGTVTRNFKCVNNTYMQFESKHMLI